LYVKDSAETEKSVKITAVCAITITITTTTTTTITITITITIMIMIMIMIIIIIIIIIIVIINHFYRAGYIEIWSPARKSVNPPTALRKRSRTCGGHFHQSQPYYINLINPRQSIFVANQRTAYVCEPQVDLG